MGLEFKREIKNLLLRVTACTPQSATSATWGQPVRSSCLHVILSGEPATSSVYKDHDTKEPPFAMLRIKSRFL